MRIAVCQMAAGLIGRSARLEAMREAVDEAASNTAQIIVFPELSLTGYGSGQRISETAESIEGIDVGSVRDLSARHGVAVAAGVAIQDGDSVYNAAIFADPSGSLVRYDKIHLYGDYENRLFCHGVKPPPVFVFKGMTVALLVCFDVEFPERVRDLALRGADLILVPTALPQSEAGAFIAGSVLPVRAFENQVFIAYSNHCGADEAFTYQGCSSISAPDGSKLAQAFLEPDLIYADLYPQDFDGSRQQNPYLDEVRRTQNML